MDAEIARRIQAAIGATVGTLVLVSPRTALRLFGVADREVTGAADFGWRLFGVRTAAISIAAARGDASARRVFLPVQLADQAVFAHAHRTRSLPRRTTVTAVATSAAIIALDLAARAADEPR